MKRLNFNIKDRKILYGILCIVLVSVFTLTVAYAALNAVLDISGSADVVASSWNVHFDNVKVISGSTTTDAPILENASSLKFNTTLNIPGDFYEFTVDVVNSGSIDAMIENITKTPTLSASQEKYLKYEITYQNDESITTQQLVEKGLFVKLKVRVEYRKDVSSDDLPKTSEKLTLGLKLDYTQADGSGSSITDNGIKLIEIVNGDLNIVGSEICIIGECFYVLSSDYTSVKLLSKYNIDILNNSGQTTRSDGEIIMTNYATDSQKGENYVDYSGSLIEQHVNNYNNYLSTLGVVPIESRLITKDELLLLGCTTWSCSKAPSWVSVPRNYWTSTAYDDQNMWVAYNSDVVFTKSATDYKASVRPVIVISKDYFPKEVINFTIGGVSYQADVGMTWNEWIDSEYNIDGFEKDTVDDLILDKNGYNINGIILSDVIVSEKNYVISSSLPPL